MPDDREFAGRELAELLNVTDAEDPIVIGIVRSGVPVASAIARTLGLPWDVVVVSKLRMAGDAVAAIGALAEDGSTALNVRDGRQRYVRDLVATAKQRCQALVALYRGDRPFPRVHGRTVIVADDAMASGATARAALRLLRRAGAAKIVIAVPFAVTPAADLVQREVDDLVALEIATPFAPIRSRYASFEELRDEQVLAGLSREQSAGGSAAACRVFRTEPASAQNAWASATPRGPERRR